MTDSEDNLEPAVHTNDGFFKAVFSQPEHATAFFKSHLPPSIVAKIDWPSLATMPGSFVKSKLQQMHSDLLFSVRIGERETLLYLLFEHQSTPDPSMPLRLLGYVTEILTQHQKSHGFPLTPVLPLVLHQGPLAWNISTAFLGSCCSMRSIPTATLTLRKFTIASQRILNSKKVPCLLPKN